MPENAAGTGASNSDQNDNNADDVRARFSHLEGTDATEEAVGDILPPVPQIAYSRPPTEAEVRAQKANDKGPPGRILGGGGIVGNSRDVKGSGIALTIGTNLVASIIVGTGLGWLVDTYLLHSKQTPWGLIVGFLLGVTAGFVSLVRAANQLNKD